jgi:hypothetical protein
MRDTVTIKAQNGGAHFEIKRELVETVSATDLENRLQSIEGEIELMNDQLEKLHKNRKIILEAMSSGKAKGVTDTDTKLV